MDGFTFSSVWHLDPVKYKLWKPRQAGPTSKLNQPPSELRRQGPGGQPLPTVQSTPPTSSPALSFLSFTTLWFFLDLSSYFLTFLFISQPAG